MSYIAGSMFAEFMHGSRAAKWVLRRSLICAASSALWGCLNPNLYQTPRTTPKREFSHIFATESIGFRGQKQSPAGTNTTKSAAVFFPALPTYQLRYGISERVDLGARIANLSALGADLKWNFTRGNVDAAINPNAQFYYSPSVFGSNNAHLGGLLSLPLPVGFNFGESLSFVLTPGVLFAALGEYSGDASGPHRIHPQLGAGLDIRFSKSFVLHPQVTVIRGGTHTFLYTIGFGFKFGSLPGYSDQAERSDLGAL